MTTITHAPPSLDGPPAGTPPPTPFGLRLATGLLGVLIAAMMSGLNNRVGAIALADVQGALGLGVDAGHLLGTVYTASELAAMPIAAWFSVTFSFRRFHCAIVVAFLAIGILLPLAPGYGWLLALRAVAGAAGRRDGAAADDGGAAFPAGAGQALWPRLLFAHRDLRAEPGHMAGGGLARPCRRLAAGLLAGRPRRPVRAGAVWWGIPQDPVRTERFREIDWLGLATGPARAGADRDRAAGGRTAWTGSTRPRSPPRWPAARRCSRPSWSANGFITSRSSGCRVLGRHNFWLGFLIFVGILIVLTAGAALPADQLIHVQGFRPRELAPIGLIVALPQIVLAPAVSALLYMKWLDARHMMATGLFLMAAGLFLGSHVTSEWMVAQFWLVQLCQTLGQPLAVIPLLFLVTGFAAPMEGPFVSGLVNMLRAISSIVGGVIVEQGLIRHGAAHLHGMVDRAGRLGIPDVHGLPERFEVQATTLAIADLYAVMALLAAALILPTLCLHYLPAPTRPRPAKD